MLLEVKNLAKDYATGSEPVTVLRDVSFGLAARETVALEGESGCGKSTVLHLVAGLDEPTSGSIELDGVQMVGLSDRKRAFLRRSQVGVIFQQFNLIPSLTVSDNIAFHAKLGGRFGASWCEHLVETLGLSAHLNKYPEMLSGGQQQRVAIARTLAARPKLILADEPTGNLDEDTADTVLSLMLDRAVEADAAILMVTHSQRLAAAMQRRLVLSHGVVKDRAALPSGGIAQ